VREFDALDMLIMLAERCVELLDVSATGIVLTDGNGGRLGQPPEPRRSLTM
jgi:hypothetical protein